MISRRGADSYQPGPFPVDFHIVYDRVQFLGDVEGRVLGEHYGSTIVAVFERFKDLRNIVPARTQRGQGASLP